MEKKENVKDYVNIVTSKNNAKRTFLISIIALLVSSTTLFINFLDKREEVKDLKSQEKLIQCNYPISGKYSLSNE